MKSVFPFTRFAVLTALIMLVGVMLAGCGGSTEGLLGQDLYSKSCEGCHGADGLRGTQIGAGSPSVELTDQQIRGAIAVGPGSMPGFPRLTSEQLDSLVDFVRELQTGGDGG